MMSMSGHASGLDPAEDVDRTQPSAPSETAERRQAVQKAIESLSDDRRAVVVLKDIEGHSYETIAEIVQCPVGTVRSRLHRARMELKEKLVEWIKA